MNAEEIYRRIQKAAREESAGLGGPVPTQAYLTRHALESFLDRLNRTAHAFDLVLKDGLLLGAYGVRRPTKDADSNAISADTTPDHLEQVVRDVADVAVDDGVTFELDSITVTDIRDDVEYPGMRLRPVAEKGVTILERGITSTRWRDYVDIVTLGGTGLDLNELARAARAVAAYRGVELVPIGPVVEGYGALGQAKWAAWRRKEGLTAVCEESLDDQMVRVAAILDPVFGVQKA